MKTYSLLLLVAITLTQCGNKKNQEPLSLSNIGVSGNQFMTNTDTITFQGLCLEDLGELDELGHWNKNYIDQAAKWNINIVRFPVHPKHWKRLGKEKYLEELNKGVAWAKEHHLYSIIDWHVIGNMKDEKWQHPMYETTLEETLDFWATMANTFKDEPAVAFYELYNEPTTFSGALGEMSWAELIGIYKQILDTVRVYDSSTVALLAGFNWAYDLRDLQTLDPQFTNVGYVSHPYPQKSEQPWAKNWDEVFGFAAKNHPVFATEFGFAYPDQVGAHIPVISDDTYGQEVLDYFKTRNISYTLWVFSWHWYPTLLKDSTYTLEKGQGEFFYQQFAKNKGRR